MARTGIAHPEVIDLVTRKDDLFNLVISEARQLGDEDAIALQAKLNAYLGFVVDGGLNHQFPESCGKPVEIRVELFAEPSEFILGFVRRYSEAIVEHGITLSVFINGEPVP